MFWYLIPRLPSFSVPLPWERGHCAAVCSQTAAADHWRQKGLCVCVWYPPEAAAPHFPGPWLSHQGACTGCLRGLLRHWLCRGQHEGDTGSITRSLTCRNTMTFAVTLCALGKDLILPSVQTYWISYLFRVTCAVILWICKPYFGAMALKHGMARSKSMATSLRGLQRFKDLQEKVFTSLWSSCWQ